MPAPTASCTTRRHAACLRRGRRDGVAGEGAEEDERQG